MYVLKRVATVAAFGAMLLPAGPAPALFHAAVIDEVLTSYDGDTTAQFIEIRMLAAAQSFVSHSVLAAFDSQGAYVGDILVVPTNVAKSGAGVRWLAATEALQTASGVTPDFIMPAGVLPTGGGMLCFGGGGGVTPQNPPAWDRTAFATYVDCVAYGNYSGPSNAKIGTPTSLTGDGHSLQRSGNTMNNADDFTCGDPATPQNNAGDMASLAATGSCSGASTPTPTPTPMLPPAITCVGDCNGDGMVSIDELIRGVNEALGVQPVDDCPAFACEEGPAVTINCLIQAVNNALVGCPATPTPTEPSAVVATPTSLPEGALGVRRFSIDPETSRFIAVLAGGGAFPNTGFEGFLELTAGVEDPASGLAFIDLTDASEYLSVNVPAGGQAVCIKVLRDQLPIHNAGVIACKGGLPVGIRVTQNHRLGVVGTCTAGANAGMSCGTDGDCDGAHCFTASDCTAAGGSVEGAQQPHPGDCNGPLVGSQSGGVSGPGSMAIAPEPSGIIKGIPVELIQERATPCGDEGLTGQRLSIGFTTSSAVGEILSFNNDPSATLSADITGEPFSCDTWTQEDGPGTLVLSAANLDTQIAPGIVTDIIAQFELKD